MLPHRETGVPFLDLHWKIRRHIYHLAGLTRSCPIALTGTSSCLIDEEARGTLPTGLFTVSRYISSESLQEFHGRNRFAIVVNHPSDLDAVRRIPRRALYLVQFIELYLNPWRSTGIHNDNICLLHGEQTERHWRAQLPLSIALESITTADQGMLWALSTFCEYLSHISTDLARLTLFCNVQSQDIAAKIHKSIRRLDAPACKVRLHIQTSTPAGLLADTDEKQTLTGFPFFKLPAELRFAILSYTDLHPRVGSDPYSEDLFLDRDRLRTSYWCRSTVASDRSFRTIPFPLFLVSKQMRREAEHVLFSHNCLNFDGGVTEVHDYLARSSKERLRSIRHLRVCFQPVDISQWLWHTRSTWHKLVDFIANNLNTSALCLAVNLGEFYIPEARTPLDQGNIRFEWEATCELALDLCWLHLRDFHLTLPTKLAFLETPLEQKVVDSSYDSSRGNGNAKRANGYWFGRSTMRGQGCVYFGRDREMKTNQEVPTWHAQAWEAMTRSYNVADEEYKIDEEREKKGEWE